MTTRREACLGLLAALVSPPLAASAGAAATELETLVRALPSRGSARAVGAAYLASHPEERCRWLLAEALLAEPAIGRALRRRPVDPRNVTLAVAEAVRGDFEQRRTVSLDGWVLSRTEARLSGLCCLV